nr:hypothetical protein [Tanacetum cinerariifolium]
GVGVTDSSPRPTFDFTAKLFSNMKLNWDGPQMPLLAPMLVVLADRDTAGVAAAAVGPTTSSRPPSLSRHPSDPEDIHEGGGDFASSPPSNEAPQTPAAMAAGGAEDSATLTALTLKLDECLHRVSTLETELGVTKKVFGGAVLKLVTRVKRLEGLLQQRKRRLVLSNSEGDDATKEQEFDLAALHTLASVTLGDDPSSTAAGHDVDSTMPVERTSTTRRRLRKSSPGVRVPAAAATISAAVRAVAPSFSIPTTADKGKAPMVDDSSPTDLLSEQERVLKNLHDSQLGEELAKKIRPSRKPSLSDSRRSWHRRLRLKVLLLPLHMVKGCLINVIGNWMLLSLSI